MAAATDCCCRRYPNGTSFSSILDELQQQQQQNGHSRGNDDDGCGGSVNYDDSGVKEEDEDIFLSVASYNLLAPLYVRPVDKRTGKIQPFAAFEWISDDDSEEVLGAESRGKKLLRSLQESDADVICLQELELQLIRDDNNGGESGASVGSSSSSSSSSFVLPPWILPILNTYEIRLPPRSELEVIAGRNSRILGSEIAVTCAVLYHKDRLQEVQVVGTKEQQQEEGTARSRKDAGDTNTCVSVCLKRRKKGLLSAMEPVVVTSVHLDASNEKKRVGQLSKCLRRARYLLGFRGPDTKLISTIVAGDMNSECRDGSCVAGFLTSSSRRGSSSSSTPQPPPCVRRVDFERECASALRLKSGQVPDDEQLKEWMELHSEAQYTVYDCCVSLDRVCLGKTHSAYEASSEAPATRKTIRQWRLDHIFYTANTIQPTARWSTLEDDPESCRLGLPNHRIASDHLPVGALFRVLPTPLLREEERTLLLKNIYDMEVKQKEGWIEHQRVLDEELAALEARVYPKHQDNTDDNENCPCKKMSKKKRNDKKRSPPEEIVEFMRRKRELLKQVKARYKDERYAFINEIGDLQRLLIQQEYGCTARQWADRGYSTS